MQSAQVRRTFIDYFKKNAHTEVSSSSLIPENDPTLLFTNAGMNQFKNAFLGLEKRSYSRAVTSQKCVRAGGKHNDLDNVGFTARHHTFFEMLGNFSFGDYFKKEAIHMAWELLTKEFQIPKEKLYVSVFETDDEAADIWHKQEGVPRDRIFRFGEKDNFWRMGDVGPCGPCSEIFYDHGPKAGLEADPYKGILSGEDRYVEIWNNVFMQYEEKAPGVKELLPKPSVDTGSGLERMTAVLQRELNNYDTDLFLPLIHKACDISGVDYVKDTAFLKRDPRNKEITAALRVLADHARSTAFLIADGALPSNEGRGYVLRRIVRRALRFGRKLTADKSIFPDVVFAVIEQMGSVYPELTNRKDFILSAVKDEELRFLTTLDQGSDILSFEMNRLQKSGALILPGDVVFKLYDTYGFPLDLTELMAQEKGLQIDKDAFEKFMQDSRLKAKASWKGKSLSTHEAHLIHWTESFKSNPTLFVGYDSLQGDGRLVGLSNGDSSTSQLEDGQTGFAISDKTPFYAEAGGQVSDRGYIETSTGLAEVVFCKKINDVYIHSVNVQKGFLKDQQTAHLVVADSERRQIMANHSATHLLHAALRKILGHHVTQAGSLVDSDKTRFDFTHNKPLSSMELLQIESLVNEQIQKALPVQVEVMSHDQALGKGAMALFGEKYGQEVRVLTMGDFSCELCGGTHVSNTSQIRLFKIVSENGVSSGIRRIEAFTGEKAFAYLNALAHENLKVRHHLGLGLNLVLESVLGNGSDTSIAKSAEGSSEILDWIEKTKNEIKTLQKEIKKIQSSNINTKELAQLALTFQHSGQPHRVLCVDLADVEDREILAQITDDLKNKIQSGVIVILGHSSSGSHPLIVSTTASLTKDFPAGTLLKEAAALMGGKGGGRPDFAQGAVPNRQAWAQVKDLIYQRVAAVGASSAGASGFKS